MGDSFIITDACIGTTDMSCIEVCPVDCIYAVGDDPDKDGQPYMLVIDPDECISCGACEPECPVEAIMIEDNVPPKWSEYTEINYMHSGRGDNDGPNEEERLAKNDIAERAKRVHLQLQGDPAQE